MGNNDNWDPHFHDDSSQQVPKEHRPNANRPRIGLTPTEGVIENYKRSGSRASRRSRSERTSYLMATGHLDIRETVERNSTNEKPYVSDDHHNSQSNGTSSNLQTSIFSETQAPMLARPTDVGNACGDSALQNLMSPSKKSKNHYDLQDDLLAHNDFKLFNDKSKLNNYNRQNDNRAKFKQTYAEVNLPMKTSPAFEYILRDNRRRNRRYCLWTIYIILVSTCIAIITFSLVHLALRNQLL